MAERKTSKQQAATAKNAEPEAPQAPEQPDAPQEPEQAPEAPQAPVGVPTGVSGPGTGAAAPADEQQRTPEGTVLATDAGPLVPTDVQKVNQPAEGHPESSTNPVAASAAQRSVPGSNHVRLVDDNDDDVPIDDLFSVKDPTDPSVYVTTTRRVYQIFTYPGARTETRQLLYPEGAKVTVFEAERVKASLRASQG